MSAKQPHPFDPQHAAKMDEPERERWFPSDAAVEHLDVPAQARVLDFGTGTGRYAIRIAREHPEAHVDAFDSQDGMLELARTRVQESGARNITLIGPRASFSAAYDRVALFNAFHEIDDAEVQRIHDLLAPGGFALVIDWDAAIARDVGPPPDHSYTPSEAESRLHAFGFTTESIEDARFPYHFIFIARSIDRTGCGYGL